jgi:hypothetical protein
MEEFLYRQNVARFREKIRECMDPAQLSVLQKLLSEEEARHRAELAMPPRSDLLTSRL